MNVKPPVYPPLYNLQSCAYYASQTLSITAIMS